MTKDRPLTAPARIVPVPGFWLGARAWDELAPVNRKGLPSEVVKAFANGRAAIVGDVAKAHAGAAR